MSERPTEPFEIKDCALITLAIGRTALNLRELRNGIADVPLQSLYHHFHETLLRPSFDDPEYRNDFASWAKHRLHDSALAERLNLIDPMEYESIEDLRVSLVETIEDRLAETLYVPSASPGHEFQFLRSQVVVFDTGQRVWEPADLAALVPRMSTGSIFFHFVEAHRRPPLHEDDFSAWLRGCGPAYDEVRRRLAAIDFTMWPLAETRDQIASCFTAVPARERVQ